MAKEATLVIVKPDGMRKFLAGHVISKLSETKLSIVAAKIVSVSKELAEEHYKHLKKKPFFGELIDYITGGNQGSHVLAMVYYGDDALSKIRDIAGATNPEEAEPGTIRGMYGRITTKGEYENVVHASSDAAESEREIKLWFKPDEIYIDDLYPTIQREVTSAIKDWA